LTRATAENVVRPQFPGLEPGTRVIAYPGDTARDGVSVKPRMQANERGNAAAD